MMETVSWHGIPWKVVACWVSYNVLFVDINEINIILFSVVVVYDIYETFKLNNIL